MSDYDGNSKEVAFNIHKAVNLLKQGKLQVARHILSNLASEVRVTTTSIPSNTFSGVIKQAMTLINTGKTDQAEINLNKALETLVVNAELIPLPAFRAEALLNKASALEHMDDLSKQKNRREIRSLSKAAKNELELGELLGYGNKSDYRPLYQEIDAINKTLFAEKSKAIWQNTKNILTKLKDKIKALSQPAGGITHPHQ